MTDALGFPSTESYREWNCSSSAHRFAPSRPLKSVVVVEPEVTLVELLSPELFVPLLHAESATTAAETIRMRQERMRPRVLAWGGGYAYFHRPMRWDA